MNSYKEIHSKAILVDTHNDILSLALEKGYDLNDDLRGKTHSDFHRWKIGGLNVQVFSVWCDENKKNPFSYANQQIDVLDECAKKYPTKLKVVHTKVELEEAVSKGILAAMVGIEGGHMIEDDLSKIDHFYQRGARYITLTWNNSSSWASSAFDEKYSTKLKHKGLSKFGYEVIKRMNALGMMVDVSHAGEQTFWDVIQTSTKPIIASHSCVYSICPTQRNLKDDQLKAIAKNGGLVQVNFYSEFLDSDFKNKKEEFLLRHSVEKNDLLKNGTEDYFAELFLFSKYKNELDTIRSPLSLLIDHIEYIVGLIGVDHVGLGSDFDGMLAPPKELDDVSKYPLITKLLVEKGYVEKDILKILGENFLRVLKANED